SLSVRPYLAVGMVDATGLDIQAHQGARGGVVARPRRQAGAVRIPCPGERGPRVLHGVGEAGRGFVIAEHPAGLAGTPEHEWDLEAMAGPKLAALGGRRPREPGHPYPGVVGDAGVGKTEVGHVVAL